MGILNNSPPSLVEPYSVTLTIADLPGEPLSLVSFSLVMRAFNYKNTKAESNVDSTTAMSRPDASRTSSSSEQHSLASNPYNPNSAAYLAYPVKHVVSSLYRRMTEPPDQPVNRLLDAPSIANSSGSTYASPARQASPFQPPPLSPLTLEAPKLSTEQSESLLLTRSLAEEIRLLVPARLQLLTNWRLAYSLNFDGSSLATLYSHCASASGAVGATQRSGYILVIRDASVGADDGSIFGAYLTDPPKPSQHYFGTGECFLWKASILPSLRSISVSSAKNSSKRNVRIGSKYEAISDDLLELAGLPPPPSADTTNAQRMTTVRGERRGSSISHGSKPTSPIAPAPRSPSPPLPSGTSTPDRIRFKAFPYSGLNDFMIYCQADFLSVGGGDGHYGLWLDDQLENGVSESCPTFGNEGLSDEGKKFDIMGIEVWYVGAGT